jgi:hypothetical protein
VVEVQADRYVGGPRESEARRCQWLQGAVVAHRVVADGEDHRPLRSFGPLDDGFGVLEGDGVERGHPAVAGAGVEDQ